MKLTKEEWELVVKQDGWALGFVPEKLRTKELCDLAVKQDGWALDSVPHKLRTKELCELAVKQYGSALKTFKQYSWSLGFVPDELKKHFESGVKNETN